MVSEEEFDMPLALFWLQKKISYIVLILEQLQTKTAHRVEG